MTRSIDMPLIFGLLNEIKRDRGDGDRVIEILASQNNLNYRLDKETNDEHCRAKINNIQHIEKGIPLIYIVIQFGRLDLLKLFIERGAEISFQPNEPTLLEYAADFNQTEIYEYLIEKIFDKSISCFDLIQKSKKQKINHLIV